MGTQCLRPSPTAMLNPRCDAIFKALFTDNSAEGRLALKSFLEAVLEAKVSNVHLIPSETAIESEHDKQAIFDIACTLNDVEAVNIEMQGINISMSYDKRAEYNAAHLLNHFTPKGTELKDIPIENLTPAEKWGKFLLYADDTTKIDFIKELCSTEEGIMAAEGILSKISQDDINWVRQNSQDKWYRDYISGMGEARRQGIAEGLEQGRAESQARIAELEARLAKYESIQ